MLLLIFILGFFTLGVAGFCLALIGVAVAARKDRERQRLHEIEMAQIHYNDPYTEPRGSR